MRGSFVLKCLSLQVCSQMSLVHSSSILAPMSVSAVGVALQLLNHLDTLKLPSYKCCIVAIHIHYPLTHTDFSRTFGHLIMYNNNLQLQDIYKMHRYHLSAHGWKITRSASVYQRKDSTFFNWKSFYLLLVVTSFALYILCMKTPTLSKQEMKTNWRIDFLLQF